MGILTEGFDQRQERQARQALPICEDCPKLALKEALQSASASEDAVVREAGDVAKQLLRITGCSSPEVASAETPSEFAVPGSQEKICGNPNADAAQTVITHTQAAISAEQT